MCPPPDAALADAVVKIGGGLLAAPAAFDAALAIVGTTGRSRRLLIVAGGGLFADAVREADRRFGLAGTTAHWMAILAMDQHAHLIASRLSGSAIVEGTAAIATALDGGLIPVLAPSRWLRDADPLPHSWEVTSDSIAAWVAGQVGARRLVLVKPPGVKQPDEAVDAYFARAVPTGVVAVTVAADQTGLLKSALIA